MTVDELKKAVEDGSVDTVLLAIADMEGRLQGKRLTASHFLEDVLEHGAEGCNYLLAVDVDMETVEGYAMASWERGYGDFEMVPDLDTLRPIPWHPATVLVMADLQWHGGEPVVASPRQILRRQLDRLAERGWTADGRHRAGVHAVQGHLRGRLEGRLPRPRAGQPLQRRLLAAGHRAGRAADPPHPQRDGGRRACGSRTPRASATSASTRSTSATARRCKACDEHAIYKNGVKEIAAQEEMAITFMAKFNELEGNSCHIHCSLATEDGANVFGEDRDDVRALRGRPAGRACAR